MTENDGFTNEIMNRLNLIGNAVTEAQKAVNDFTSDIMQNFMDKTIENRIQVKELICEHSEQIIDQEQKRREAVAESAKTEAERNEILEEAIELEGDLIEAQKEREKETLLQSENMKKIGNAALEALKSMSGTVMEIRRKEAEDKKALIDKELEYTLSSLNKEREAKLITAGFAVENNAKSLEEQLEAAKNKGDEELAYDLERHIKEKEINDEYDRLVEEANQEAAKKKAKLEFDVAKQEHSLNLINAINAGALAIAKAFAMGYPLGPIFAAISGTATAVQIAAIKKNSPKMPSFSSGGIVPGSSFSGDKVLSALNSREGVFTLEDQEYLFDQIQERKLGGGQVNNTTIVVMFDGKEIAKSTIQLVNDGYYTIKARAVR